MKRKLLHVGCGPAKKHQTIPFFFGQDWEEIRYDIDKNVEPDILGDLTDMSALPAESIDAVYSSHNIEHLYDHQVLKALKEMYRVLKHDGFLVVTCPDMRSVCKFAAENGVRSMAYMSPMGPITPHDMIYGHGVSMQKGNLFMAHKSGFDSEKLHDSFANAGFYDFASFVDQGAYALWGVARKSQADQSIEEFASKVFVGVTSFES